MQLIQRRASIAPAAQSTQKQLSTYQRLKQAVRSLFRRQPKVEAPKPVEEVQPERKVSVDVPNLESLFADEDELLLSQAPLPLVQMGKVRDLARRFESLNASAHRLHPVSRMAKSMNDVQVACFTIPEIEEVAQEALEVEEVQEAEEVALEPAEVALPFPSQFVMERAFLLAA